jgi:hypothetical protein
MDLCHQIHATRPLAKQHYCIYSLPIFSLHSNPWRVPEVATVHLPNACHKSEADECNKLLAMGGERKVAGRACVCDIKRVLKQPNTPRLLRGLRGRASWLLACLLKCWCSSIAYHTGYHQHRQKLRTDQNHRTRACPRAAVDLGSIDRARPSSSRVGSGRRLIGELASCCGVDRGLWSSQAVVGTLSTPRGDLLPGPGPGPVVWLTFFPAAARTPAGRWVFSDRPPPNCMHVRCAEKLTPSSPICPAVGRCMQASGRGGGERDQIEQGDATHTVVVCVCMWCGPPCLGACRQSALHVGYV